jgi:hypothetical protein
VILSEPTSTIFGRVLGFMYMTPGARAVSGSSPSPNCIFALDESGNALTLGNSNIDMPLCSIADNADLFIDPSGAVNALTAAVTGSCGGGGGGSGCLAVTNLLLNAPPVTDPLSALPPPVNPGNCQPALLAVSLVGNRCYTTITSANGPDKTLTLGPGLYYMTGPVLIGENTTVIGTGVMFYFAGTAAQADCRANRPAGCISVGNHSTWSVSAQTTGPYRGILFFQSPTNQLDAQFDGNNPTYDLSGVLYFPQAAVTFRNGINATNDCTLFVALTILINNGTGSFNNACSAYGGSPLLTVTVGE